MIISHKYKFIFIRTEKTASTSMENALYPFLTKGDICSGLVEGNIAEGLTPNPPLNHRGFINPFCDCKSELSLSENLTLLGGNVKRFRKRLRFHRPHMPAWMIRNRLPEKTWHEYFSFCFERNPYDKVVSYYFHLRAQGEEFTEMSFDDYISRGRFPLNYPKYTDQLDSGVMIVDHVAKFENLEQELLEISKMLGLPRVITMGEKQLKGNFRPKNGGHYRELIHPDHKAEIDRVFSRELVWHQYEF